MFLQFHSSFDLFKKIEKQFNKLILTEQEEEKTFYLWDIILSLNHLPEWVINDERMEVEHKLKCIELFNPYKDNTDRIPKEFKCYIDKIIIYKYSPYQKAIRDISNSVKHFKVKESKIKKQEIQSGFFGYPGEDVFMDSVLQNTYVFVLSTDYFIDVEGEEINAIQFLQNSINDWRLFINNIYNNKKRTDNNRFNTDSAIVT